MLLLKIQLLDSMGSFLKDWFGPYCQMDIGKLDTAICCNKSRKSFLSSKMMGHVVLYSLNCRSAQMTFSFLSWMSLRNLKFKSFHFVDDYFDDYGTLLRWDFNLTETNSIYFDRDCRIPKSEIIKIINSCPKLNTFHFTEINNDRLLNDLFTRISPSILSNLEHFCSTYDGLTASNITHFLSHCTNLEKVSFHHYGTCRKSKSWSFGDKCSLIENNRHIKDLDWHMTTTRNEDYVRGYNLIFKHCANLVSLNLIIRSKHNIFPEISSPLATYMNENQTIKRVFIQHEYKNATGRKCSSSLTFYGAKNTTRENWNNIVPWLYNCDSFSCDLSGKILRVRDINVSAHDWTQLFCPFTGLNDIDINNCNVNDGACDTIARNCNNTLQRIVIKNNHQITSTGLRKLINNCFNLKTLWFMQ